MANYIRPAVEVYQQYASLGSTASTADLPVCIVGPAFQAYDYREETTEVTPVPYIINTQAQLLPVPSLKPGVNPTNDSIKVHMTNVVGYINSTDTKYAFSVVDKSYSTIVLTDDTIDVKLNDSVDIVVSVGGLEKTIENTKVISITRDSGKLYLTVNRRVFDILVDPKTVTGTAQIYRELPDTIYSGPEVTFEEATGSFKFGAKLVADFLVSSAYELHMVRSADCYFEYRGLIVNRGNTIYSADSLGLLESDLGKANSKNPLGLACKLAMSNGGSDVNFIGITSDDEDGYLAAIDVLETATAMYAIVPLTQDKAILQAYAKYVAKASLPENCRWAALIGSSFLTKTITGATGSGVVAAITGITNNYSLYDVDGQFMTKKTNVSDKIMIGDKECIVLAITGEDTLTFTCKDPLVDGDTYTYTVTNLLTKDQQATFIGENSATYKSNRVVIVYADKVVINGELLPAYYMAAAVGGMTAGLPPHQGFTYLAFSGIDGITGTSDYFNNKQLDTIAGMGTMIVIQDNPNAAPYIRHQLTTDMSATDFAEFSVTKNMDYVSYYVSAGLDIYLGTWNIIDQTLDIIATTLGERMGRLSKAVLPKIGAPVTSYIPPTVTQDPDYKNGIVAVNEFSLPNVLNKIIVKMIKNN